MNEVQYINNIETLRECYLSPIQAVAFEQFTLAEKFTIRGVYIVATPVSKHILTLPECWQINREEVNHKIAKLYLLNESNGLE